MTDKNQTIYWGEYALLVLATLLAAGLRVYKLGEWSVFIDEFRTWDASLNFSLDRWFYPNSRLPFWLMTRASLSVFGENPIALRLLPCIFGILTIPLMYFPIKRLFDKHVAFAAVFIIAVSPWHIYMSQMARWYSLLLLVGFFALVSFYEFCESGKKEYFFGYVLLSYFAATLHLTGFFLPMIAGAYLVLLLGLPQFRNQTGPENKLLLSILLLHFVVGLAFIPKFMGFVSHWSDLEELVGSWGRDFTLKALYHMTPSVVFSALIGLVLLLIQKDRRSLFLVVYCILPFLVLSVFASLELNVSARYQLFALPAVTMAAAFTVASVRSLAIRHGPLLYFAMMMIIGLPSLQTDYLYFTSEYGYRHRSREVYQYLKQRIAKDDQLFVAEVYSSPREQAFYVKSLLRLEDINIEDERVYTSSSVETLDLGRRTWVVTRGRAPENPEGFRKWVAENARLLAEFPARRGPQDQTMKVYLYSPPWLR